MEEMIPILLLLIAVGFVITVIVALLPTAGENSPEDGTEAQKDTVRNTCKVNGSQSPETTDDQSGKPVWKGRVRHVIDGDTVIVRRGWGEVRIRLDGIDCPEDGQPWGDIATRGLIKQIGGREVRVEEHGTDRYDRVLATLYVRDRDSGEWRNVNERMVMLGHAWVLRGWLDHLPRSRREQLLRLEGWARRKGVGLWRQPNPVPPWRWRRGDGVRV